MNQELSKDWEQIKKSFGIKAFERIENHCSRLYMKIEDLSKSREKWKEQCFSLQRELDNFKLEFGIK